ncbi:MAG: bifunctional diaminohydroxyphosphoribosylaminopyrimidine deaminase/5-amino-6-(5-phosphoribosylamino)uracil reductase RibD [Cyclobacteriaceae bacterium]
MDSASDKRYMLRAIQLAWNGLGHVSPNPMVGCVVVVDGKIIGEGYHQKYGGPHAEVNAINSVVDKSQLREATVYVTLEPCSHHGKTPPCADLLISHQVKRVVVAAGDPNPLVNGNGIEKLRAAGVEVDSGLCETEAKEQNIRFNTVFLKNRPYIILKWAQTKDGFIARSDYSSKWISHSLSRQMVHKWRTEEDAILIGKNTAIYDNPRLTSRDWKGKDPLRIVLDRNKALDKGLNLFTDEKPTLVYTLRSPEKHQQTAWIQLDESHFLEGLLTDLHERRIQSLIIEGGQTTLQTFIDRGLWDEARVFIGDNVFNEGISAPKMTNEATSETKILEDQLLTYYNK